MKPGSCAKDIARRAWELICDHLVLFQVEQSASKLTRGSSIVGPAETVEFVYPLCLNKVTEGLVYLKRRGEAERAEVSEGTL
jgi:hypothetical protein